MSESSEAAEAIHRLCDIGEMIACGLFSIAAGTHTKTPGDQRNMAAVFEQDARSHYGDVWKKLEESERQRLHRFIAEICKAKK